MPQSTCPRQSISLKSLALAASAAFAEAPGVDAERSAAQPRQFDRVGRRLQRGAAIEQLALAEDIVAAVGMVVEDGGEGAAARRAHKIGRDRFDPIEVEQQRLQDITVPFDLAELLDSDRATAVGQIAEQV
jgi:hypothetical protein